MSEIGRRIGRWITLEMVIAFAVIFSIPFWIEAVGLYQYLGVEILIWMIYALGFNLLLGYTGKPSFGHGAYFGIGAYAFGLAQQHVAVNTWLGIAIAILAATLAGYPARQPRTSSNGIKISRRYLTPGGKPITSFGPFKSGDRMIVELSFSAEKRLPNALLVDLLPACLEGEDPNLSGSMVIDDIEVDKKTIKTWHKNHMNVM